MSPSAHIPSRILSHVTSRWQAYDDTSNTALMEYDNVKATVHLEQIDQLLPRKGDVVQCIGEIMEVKR